VISCGEMEILSEKFIPANILKKICSPFFQQTMAEKVSHIYPFKKTVLQAGTAGR
jgi:hypothetical protein